MSNYSDSDSTPELRLAAAIDQFPCDDADSLPEWKAYTPILLIEKGTYGTWWLTLHENKAEAIDYNQNQEYPEDWDILALVNLNTGEEV
jgi:hypothetical protein